MYILQFQITYFNFFKFHVKLQVANISKNDITIVVPNPKRLLRYFVLYYSDQFKLTELLKASLDEFQNSFSKINYLNTPGNLTTGFLNNCTQYKQSTLLRWHLNLYLHCPRIFIWQTFSSLICSYEIQYSVKDALYPTDVQKYSITLIGKQLELCSPTLEHQNKFQNWLNPKISSTEQLFFKVLLGLNLSTCHTFCNSLDSCTFKILLILQ
eukprot:TRINITY_DN6477_c1_g1_i4.p1 TRINITY_DN6477_c1_g1~~TRINITY_DN6477_c1_g1_i4.p1  ORF type:complete len:211 (+),score=-20.50 TRINITY_DN6477_c1_g1_i4:116-748(+)